MRTRRRADAKLEELTLYVAGKCEADPTFGATKLNKILFYADFIAYAQTGESITGAEYQKLRHGPAPRRLVPVLKRLEKAGASARAERSHFGLKQERMVALRDADLSGFTGEEIAAVDEVIGTLWGKSARDVSELSHRFRGWQLASEGETIPYETVFLAPERELSEQAKARGREIAARHLRAQHAAP